MAPTTLTKPLAFSDITAAAEHKEEPLESESTTGRISTFAVATARGGGTANLPLAHAGGGRGLREALDAPQLA